MLDAVAASGDPDGYVKDLLDSSDGSWASATASTGPRTRARASCKRTAKELGSPRFEVAEALEEAALAALVERKPDYVIATNVEFYSAVVLDLAEVPPDSTPAMFACARVAGWSAHILEEKRTGTADPPVRASTSGRLPVAVRCLSSPQRLPRRTRWPSAGAEQELAGLRDEMAGRGRGLGPRRRTTASGGRLSGDRRSSATARRPSYSGVGSRTRARPAAAPR